MILGLSWGGTTYPWTSYQVIATLSAGAGGMILFLFAEAFLPLKEPTVPFVILSHRTSLVGFLCTFLHGALVTAAVYYLPVRGPIKRS